MTNETQPEQVCPSCGNEIWCDTCAGKSAEDKPKRVTIESGTDPRIFSSDYAAKLKIKVNDACVYDSESDTDLDEARRKLAEAERRADKLDKLCAIQHAFGGTGTQGEFIKTPTWHSYATPPTEQDGVKLVNFSFPVVFYHDGKGKIGIVEINWPGFPAPGPWPELSKFEWSHIPLPKLPPEPEQDADEAAFEKWWNSEERTAFLNAKLDCEQAWQAALDFARKQERL